MKTIVFMGDSITDAGRLMDRNNYMGDGYVTMTAGRIAYDYPGKYQMFNKGISGHKMVDVYSRIKRDTINLKPDILTLLIGVNDVWHELNEQNGSSNESFGRVLEWYLLEVKEALPDVKIVMMEPFVLPGTGTEQYFETFYNELRVRSATCKAVAEKMGIPYITLQEDMTALAEKCTPDYVLFDGVHPNSAGHELISRKLYDALKPIL